MIKNLALKGGGVKGIAYVGALRELENANMLNGNERIAGTSAGSLVAGMVCAGYNVDAIEQLMYSIDFKKCESGFNPFRIFSRYGMYSGDYILNFIHDFLNKSPKKLQPNATFYQMQQAGCKNLYVFSCNVSKHTVEEFSVDVTPDIIVAEAIRASMSIPFFFNAWQFSDNVFEKQIFVDGGVVFNYPLSFFDNVRFNNYKNVNYDSIGLYLYAKNKSVKTKLSYRTPLHFTKKLFESLMDTQDFLMNIDPEQMQRSIMIEDFNIPATDFKISKDDMNRLVDSGNFAAKEYLKTMNKNNEETIV